MAGAFDPNKAPFLTPIDTSSWVRQSTPSNDRNLFVAGLSSGTDNLQGLLGSAVELGGRLTGWKGAENYGAGVAQRNEVEAQQNGRADLEIAPWKEGGASVLPWLAYQTAKQIPQLAGYIGATALVPEVAIPAGLARLGALAPALIGGGRGLAAEAAAVAGQAFARRAVGTGAVGLPMGQGALYQAAKTNAEAEGREVSTSEALTAAVGGIPYAALDLADIGILANLTKQATGKGLVKRVATGMFTGAAAELPQEGLQTAMEQSFRKDLSPRDRFANIVEGALTGAAVGGTLGGTVSIRKAKTMDPSSLDDGTLNNIVGEALGLPAPATPGGPQVGEGEGAKPFNVDSGGRAMQGAFPGLTADGFDPGMSATDKVVAGYQPGMQPQIESQTIIQPKSGSLRWAQDSTGVEQRPFGTSTTEELQTQADAANNYLSSIDNENMDARDVKILDLFNGVLDELDFRGANQTVINGALNGDTGAVEQPADVLGGAAASNSGAPVPGLLDIDAFKRKHRNQDLVKIEAADEADLRSQVLDLVDRESTDRKDFRSSTLNAAKSLGLLDEQAAETPLATEIRAARAGATAPAAVAPGVAPAAAGTVDTSSTDPDMRPALLDQAAVDRLTATPAPAAPANQGGGDAPVDTDFQAEWTTTLANKRGTAIKSLRDTLAPNRAAAERQVFDALGASPDAKVDGYKGLVALAEDMGILDTDGKLTKKGTTIARQAVPLEEAANAAIERGYSGTEASVFDRGARGDTSVKLTSLTELKAYNDGRDWAVPVTAGDAQTNASVEEFTAQTDGLGQVERKSVQSADIPDKQQAQQKLNENIDLIYGTTVAPTEVAQLKRLVKEGKTEAEIDEAARYLATGQGGLLGEPAPARRTFAGETTVDGKFGTTVVIERGPATRAKQKIAAANQKLLEQRVLMATQQGSKAQNTATRNEFERWKDNLRGAIQDAFDNQEITAVERLGLIGRLMRNDLEGISAALAGDQLSNKQARVGRREFLNGVASIAAVGAIGRARAASGPAPASKQLSAQIRLGNITGALNAIKNSSTNSINRLIASKLLRANWDNVRLNVLGDSTAMRGETTLEDDGVSRVDIYGKDGLNEETFLHEMIHAFVQQRWAGVSVYTDNNREMVGDAAERADAAIKAFADLWIGFSQALKDARPELIENEIWAREVWSNPDELLTWVMTNEQAQNLLRRIGLDGKPLQTGEPSAWSRFVDWFRDLLGMPPSEKARSALDSILAAGLSVLDEGQLVTSNEYGVKLAARLEQQRSNPSMEKLQKMLPTPEIAPGIASVSNAQVKDVLDQVSGVVERAKTMTLEELTTKARSARTSVFDRVIGWFSVHHLNEAHNGLFEPTEVGGPVRGNGIDQYETAIVGKDAMAAQLSQMVTFANDQHDQLLRGDKAEKESAQTIGQIMQASEFGIDPAKPFREQSETVRNSPNKANLQRLSTQFHDAYRSLLTKGHAAVYKAFRDVNDVLMLGTLSAQFHESIIADGYAKALPQFAENPLDSYMTARTQREFTPEEARAWWADKLGSQVSAGIAFLDSQRTVQAQMDPADKNREGLNTHIDNFGTFIRNAQESVAKIEEAPYFHLGRFGDFFVHWAAKDDTAMATIAERLAEAGFEGVVSEGTDKRTVYMRVETQTQQANLDKLVADMAKQGLVEPGSRRIGRRTKETPMGEVVTNSQLEQLIDNIQQSGLEKEDKDREIAALRARFVDMMPDRSLARVMTKRKNIPGYSPDMMRSFSWRAQVGIQAWSGMAAAPKISEALSNMRAARDVAQKAPRNAISVSQVNAMTTIIDEISRREREHASWSETPLLDQVKGITSATFLGFSVSYGMVNTTQIGITLWPELGAKHGFVKAAKAIRDSVMPAIKIMRAVMAHGYSVSLDRSMDAVITYDVLEKVVGKETAEFLMRIVNSGNIDIGGQTRELMRSAEGRGSSAVDRYLRYASAIGYYTETASRLIAALATRKLMPNATVDEQVKAAAYNINETMWNYARTNQGRQFGKMGVMGPITPLATQFLQFQAQLTEKLGREMYTAIKGDTQESKAEARRYLKGHLAAMTALAGTLGLPAVTIFAAAIDKLSDIWDEDEEPTNIRAAYRNWLSDVVGKDAGEIIAHGGFRGLGFDISSRIGEQDIVPFSKFLADKRDFKDRVNELAFRTWGAPTSLGKNLFDGAGSIMDGNIMEGMIKMLPNAFSAPTKAYKMYEEGYVDAEGKELPTAKDPGTWDMMLQAFGFNPSVKAEYSEARMDQAGRKGVLTRRGNVLSNQIANAIEAGDDNAARDAIDAAMIFDQANPSFAVLPGIGDKLKRRTKTTAVAKATGTPLGVSPKDLDAKKLTEYADY